MIRLRDTFRVESKPSSVLGSLNPQLSSLILHRLHQVAQLNVHLTRIGDRLGDIRAQSFPEASPRSVERDTKGIRRDTHREGAR